MVSTRAHPAGPVRVLPLLRAAHIGPAMAVTVIVALLAVGRRLPPEAALLVAAAVLAGQLTIGWANDILDAARDRTVARLDKPLATGELSRQLVLRCLAGAATLCVALSLLAGWRSALVHLGLVLVSGHAYNLGLKATIWSWVPYAVAFGALPAVVTLAGETPALPPPWIVGAGAALGVAAHFLNALPDFDDDEATGVRGIPHRLGSTASRVIATALLVLTSVIAVLNTSGEATGWTVPTLATVLGLAVVAMVGRGRLPFLAAVAIALLDVLLLTVVAQ